MHVKRERNAFGIVQVKQKSDLQFLTIAFIFASVTLLLCQTSFSCLFDCIIVDIRVVINVECKIPGSLPKHCLGELEKPTRVTLFIPAFSTHGRINERNPLTVVYLVQESNSNHPD
jgi:hypothetical protein